MAWLLGGRRAASPKTLAFTILAIVSFTGLRFVHLGADTPFGIESRPGLYVDEGYKTLAPRNMILYGSHPWHEADDYPGWLGASPITQWSFYFAFQMFGVSLESARFASVCWFALLLVVFFGTTYRSVPVRFLLAGILMLGIQNTLFFYTRVALFEAALIFFFYASLFILRRVENVKPKIGLLIVFVSGVLAILFIKQTGVVLWLAAAAGIVTVTLVQRRWSQLQILSLFVAAAAALLLAIFAAKIGFVFPLGLSPILKGPDIFPVYGIFERYLANPLALEDPLLILLGLLAGLSFLTKYPMSIMQGYYRAALLGVIIVGPVILGSLHEPPTTYCVPLAPAYILLFLEWWSLNRSHTDGDKGPWREVADTTVIKLLRVGLMAMAIFYATYPAMLYVLRLESPQPVRLLLYPLIVVSLILAKLASSDKRRLAQWIPSCLLVVLVGFVAFNGFRLGQFLLDPKWQGRMISDQLSQLVQKDAVIAGDWAPVLTLNANLRTLYMNYYFNAANRIDDLRPSHFLYCETPSSRGSKEVIDEMEDVSLGAVLLRSTYNGSEVVLYELIYDREPVQGIISPPKPLIKN